MTKRITSEDCDGNIEDIEEGRYNSHVVPVAAEDDPGYEEIDYGDCTEFEVPLGRYGSHVVPIGGSGSGSGSGMKVCNGGGLEIIGTDDAACMQIKTETDGALVLDGGVLKIDSTKLKVTTDNVYPAGTDPGLLSTLPVFTDPDGNTWNNQSDYNKWLYEDQKRQDKEIEYLKGCAFPVITDVLGSYDAMLAWGSSGANWFLLVDQSLHQNEWPDPRDEEPTSLWVNKVEYPVLSSGNAGGVNWRYQLPDNCLDHLMGEEVTVSLCDPGENYVTLEEFEKDQERQDQEIEALKNSSSVPMVYWGIMPKDAPLGALWTDQDTLKQYVHTGGGTWAQIAQCAGDGEVITEEPWIYIEDLRTIRIYSSTAWGTVNYCQKIMLYEFHYNDSHPGDITQEWEWDENNDGNWVPYKPEHDPYAITNHNYTDNSYWTYEWAPESNQGQGLDPAHPHPCTKLRVRLHNTWDTGETKVSDWAYCFLARSCVEANGDTLQPPSIC